MLTSIDVKFMFDSAWLGLFSSVNISPNSRCRPSSCLLLLSLVLTLETSKMSAIFVLTTKSTQPCAQVFLVNVALTCKKAALLVLAVD